jgi:hypothetical protein
MSLEAKIEELIAALTKNSSLLERVVAGQEAALAKIDAGNPKGATTARTRSSAAATAAASKPKDEEAASTGSGEADVASVTSEKAAEKPVEKKPAASEKVGFGVFAKDWLGDKTSDGYKDRGKHLMGVLANFGAGKIAEVSEKNEEAALFFLKRFTAGKPINFDVEYDFSGDPAQDETAGDDFGGAFDDE